VTELTKGILALLVLGFTSSVNSAYWARLDLSDVSDGNATAVLNTTDQPIRCSLAALNDKIWLELGAGEKSIEIPLATVVRIHHLSLFCKPIEKMTKPRPWRVNNYSAGSEHVRHTIFFPKPKT
jgi:hypothetical protein